MATTTRPETFLRASRYARLDAVLTVLKDGARCEARNDPRLSKMRRFNHFLMPKKDED